MAKRKSAVVDQPVDPIQVMAEELCLETHEEVEEVGILETIEEVADKPLAEVVKEVKRRKPSTAERDDTGKVVRKGKNLSGNQPFREKLYYLDLDQYDSQEGQRAVEAAPGQVRLLLKFMAKEGYTTPDDAQRGGHICGEAINSGFLQSKIDPPALFAYYRRVMERLGLTQA